MRKVQNFLHCSCEISGETNKQKNNKNKATNVPFVLFLELQPLQLASCPPAVCSLLPTAELCQQVTRIMLGLFSEEWYLENMHKSCLCLN